jgi:hypothetical protein
MTLEGFNCSKWNAVRFDTNKSTLTYYEFRYKLVLMFCRMPDTDITIFGYTQIALVHVTTLKLSGQNTFYWCSK